MSKKTLDFYIKEVDKIFKGHYTVKDKIYMIENLYYDSKLEKADTETLKEHCFQLIDYLECYGDT